jgi:prepilin-type N-terminal cleavage/methylation domain-containing protein
MNAKSPSLLPAVAARRRPRPRRGFTMLEIMVVVAILGISMTLVAPAFFNSQRVRQLDITSSKIRMAIQTAQWQAAANKISYRVRFTLSGEIWSYRIEREASAGTWILVPKSGPFKIPSSITATVSLPSTQSIIFLPTGIVSNYDSTKNSIVLSSEKLQSLGQPSERTLRILAGGSVRFQKS